MAKGYRFTPVEKAAREVIRREMQSYDLLSRTPKLVYEHSVSRAIDSGALNPGYTCAHGTMLTDPCLKCERTADDCKQYRDHMIYRIKELLKQLP